MASEGWIMDGNGRERAGGPQHRVACPDCGCDTQLTHEGWRCPWATRDHRRVDGLMVACGRPYQRDLGLVLPAQTRTR